MRLTGYNQDELIVLNIFNLCLEDWFHEIGEFDDQLEVWGGENIEISLRNWMCGGNMIILPERILIFYEFLYQICETKLTFRLVLESVSRVSKK